MERQIILERLGWRFIRIRGSEFYRDPDKTIKRVISELKIYGIVPEDSVQISNAGRETELLKRVKMRAYEILEGMGDFQPKNDIETLAVALNPKSVSLENEPSFVPLRENRDAKTKGWHKKCEVDVETTGKSNTSTKPIKLKRAYDEKIDKSKTRERTIVRSSPADKNGKQRKEAHL